ncbi:MAG: ribulose-phosphate 3-epimerase [Bacteroidales bacterium]|jgi:ribulose-phosphate 3-epimerase|nr:ribulose-phosphate 3-epimerase [Bacteroidales bacterium]
MAIVSPSMLSANFLHLQHDIDFVNNSNADWFHLDIMDGVFVPNISYGLPIVQTIKKTAQKPLDVHLMIEKPERYISEFKQAGADILCVHYEACLHLHRTVQAIQQQGMKAGVALNPHTSVDLLRDILCDVDMVLIMSVNPGFGGQKFIPQSLQKIARLKELIEQTNSQALIQVDGGVDATNCRQLTQAGADVLVAGSAIFGAENRTMVVDELKRS